VAKRRGEQARAVQLQRPWEAVVKAQEGDAVIEAQEGGLLCCACGV